MIALEETLYFELGLERGLRSDRELVQLKSWSLEYSASHIRSSVRYRGVK